MKLLITHEIHGVRVGDCVYNPTGVIDYNALCNYRFTQSDLLLVSRCQDKAAAEDSWLRVDGPGIAVHAIPELNFNNPLKVLFSLPRTLREIGRAINQCDGYMVRLPGPTGFLTALMLRLKRRKYGVELVGDPVGILDLGSKVVKHQWLYRVITRLFYRHLLRKAHTVGYRSQFLRRLYPNQDEQHEWVFSGVQLDKGVIGAARDAEWLRRRPIVITFVGRIGREKGCMELLHAFAKLLNDSNGSMELHMIGDGEFLEQLQHEAARLEISENVKFCGRIPRGPELFAKLDEAHCFVLPTYSEGMPRSLIEAMAKGVACFASDIPVVRELLDEDQVFAVKSSEAIYDKLKSFLADNERLAQVSRHCFEKAKEHWPEELAKSKRGFWNDITVSATREGK